ncbi:pheromone processing endoprotease [Mortierella antarctica]|nr:pheromone processing endoprotease [Mortierella antarctica]
MLSHILGLLSAIYLPWLSCLAANPTGHLEHTHHHLYAVKFNDLSVTTPQELAEHLGMTYVGQVGDLADYHLFRFPKTTDENGSSHLSKNATASTEDVLIQRYEAFKQSSHFKHHLSKRSVCSGMEAQVNHPLGSIQKQVPRKMARRGVVPFHKRDESEEDVFLPADAIASSLQIKDPGFGYQWHLYNTMQRGNDLNITGVWSQNITGKGVVVAVIDDGLDALSEDLAANFHEKGSYNFATKNSMPTPPSEELNHGTACAGEIAAVKNDICGVGVAWDSKIAGIRMDEHLPVEEATAFNLNFQETQIYSCSWGPDDDGKTLEGPSQVVRDALLNGVTKGRNGRGSIYVFSGGNGAEEGDNCNFDGYANSLFTIAIGAISRTNQRSSYSEACSALLGVTYSNGNNSGIFTTDVGTRKCNGEFGGTSAAAPLASGIYALALGIRPDLSWRDIQHLTVQTAIPVDEGDPDWKKTAIGKLFNHKYGYGKLDAYRFVEAAKTWVSVGPQATYESQEITVGGVIPYGVDARVAGMSSVHEVTESALKAVQFGSLEHVTVTVNILHEHRGDVEVKLKSPNSVISQLAVQRPNDNSTEGFQDWTFMSVKHWGENPVGKWTLTMFDRTNPNKTGVFVDWKLGFHGEIKKNA